MYYVGIDIAKRNHVVFTLDSDGQPLGKAFPIANDRHGFDKLLAFVRLTNRLPAQQPLEILDELLTYVAVQLDIPGPAIAEY